MRALFRTFFAQFFTSETATSDVQLRQTIIWVLAFVLTPCVLILLSVFPQFQFLVIRVGHAHPPPGVITRATAVRNMLAEDMLEWTVAVLVGYSMITVGLATVFTWDALSFDCRDAMVLGPLPLPRARIVVAKLAALAAFLLGASVSVNLVNALVFAIETSDQFGAFALLTHFVGCLLVTSAAAALVFCGLVIVRSLIAIGGTARLAAIAGSLLQFAFVLALLAFVMSIFAPPARRGHLSIPDSNSAPVTWFVAWFEVLRHSERGEWPAFIAMSRPAVVFLPLAIIAAATSTVVAFGRQMRLALSPSALPGPLGHARLLRASARVLCGRDGLARALSDFVLFTIIRSRAQQAPIAINAAIGAALVVFALARERGDPGPALAAMPMMVAFWAVIGLRASFFVPSELPASWTFSAGAPPRTSSISRGVRAAALAVTAPAATALAAAFGGWRHAVSVLVLVTALVETVVVLTVDFVPFTRPYRPGYAKLKTRWPLYLVGAYGFSYALPRAPLWVAIAAIVVVEAVAPWMPRWRPQPPDEEEADGSSVTVLGLTSAFGRAPAAPPTPDRG